MADITLMNPAKSDIFTTTHVQSLVRGNMGYLVISGCDVHQATPAAMSVVVDSGYILYGGVYKTVAGGTVTIAAANATYPRIDIIYVDSNGACQVVAGTAGTIQPTGETTYTQFTSPYPNASVPTGVILARVHVGAAATTITNANIDDLAQYAAPVNAFRQLGSASTDAPDGANDVMLLWDNSASAYKYETFNNIAKRYESIIILAGSGDPTVGLSAVESDVVSFTYNTFRRRGFNHTYDTYLDITFALPDRYDGGTMTAKFYWYSTGTTSDTVVWCIQGGSFGDNEDMNLSLGPFVKATDSATGNANRVLISPATSAFTLAGTPAGGELCVLRIFRYPGDAMDTLNETVYLLGVKLEYGVNAWSD